MATETELKLLVDPAAIEQLEQHPLLQVATGQAVLMLRNTYYDTPALELAAARIALRVRQQGERYIQTLKTRGQSVNGLHQRGEWEWELDSERLDPSLLTAEIWPEALPPAEQLTLVPVFTTDFRRRLWLIRFEGADIEVAQDQGEVVCSGAEGARLSDPISELELELKAGPADALFSLARTLGQQIELRPSDISKAQRGYRLFKQHREAMNDGTGGR